MSTDTTTTTKHVQLEVELRVPIFLPYDGLDQLTDYQDPTSMSSRQLEELVQEVDGLLEDSIAEHLESMPDLEIEYVDDVDREPVEPIELRRPDEDDHWALPVPNFRGGLVRFTERGIEPVEESSVNKLTDEQVQGAHWALELAWGMRGMDRKQRESIAELLSETQWAMLARPTLHKFEPASDASIEQPADVCSYCRQDEAAHGPTESVGSDA